MIQNPPAIDDTHNVTPFRRGRRSEQRLPAVPAKAVRVHLLGTLRAIGPGGADVLPRARKAQAVLAYLCLIEGRVTARSRLAGLIWDRAGERQARESLRHALRELQGFGCWSVSCDRETVRLDLTNCWVDALEGPEQADLLLDGLHGISPAFDQWLLGERARYENRWQTRLEAELDQLVTAEAPPQQRAAVARRLLNFVPTHEAALCSVMTAFAEMGEAAQAVREFQRFKDVVGSSLGLPPSEKTMALYAAIRLNAQTRSARSTSAFAAAPASAGDASVLSDGRIREPSIAVMPFHDLSDETGRDFVVKGLVEDLVEALSRVPNLFVVSRLSAAALASEHRPPQEIGDALGVRYLLSGTMRAVGDRLRLTVELTDAATGLPLWNSRFDEQFSDLLTVQDRLTDTVIRSVAPNLRAAELRRVQVKRPEHRTAYDLFLRAQEQMHEPMRGSFETAGELFQAAIAREPRYAAALAWRAYWHVMRVGQGWSPDPAHDAAEADRFVQLAIEHDASEPMAYAVQGHVKTFLYKDFDAAFAAFETALRVNPNCPRAWLWNANAHGYRGEGALAVEKVTRAMALSPYDPLGCAYSGGASLAYLADRQYERSIEFALRCISENRSYSAAYRLLIVALVLAGRKEEARNPVHQLLRLEPGFTVEDNRRRFPGSAYPFGEVYSDALAVAGVPLSN